MRYSQPRSSHVFAMTPCLKSLYPESTFTAMSEKRMGARFRRLSSVCISAQLSFPPDRPTMMRSPSSIRLKSVIAFVVFFEIRASRAERLAIPSSVTGRLGLIHLEDFGDFVESCRRRRWIDRLPHDAAQVHEVRDDPERPRQAVLRPAEPA